METSKSIRVDHLQHMAPIRTDSHLCGRACGPFTVRIDPASRAGFVAKTYVWLCGYKEGKELGTFTDRDGIRTVSGLYANQDLPEQILSIFAQVHKSVPFHLLVEFFSDLYGFVC